MDIDAIAAAFCGGLFDGMDEDVPNGDDFAKFLHAREVAALSDVDADALEKQVSTYSGEFSKRLEKFARETPTPTPREETPTEGGSLEKNSARERKNANLKTWIMQSVAMGETAESLAAWAEGNGYAAMGAEIRKVAAEL